MNTIIVVSVLLLGFVFFAYHWNFSDRKFDDSIDVVFQKSVGAFFDYFKWVGLSGLLIGAYIKTKHPWLLAAAVFWLLLLSGYILARTIKKVSEKLPGSPKIIPFILTAFCAVLTAQVLLALVIVLTELLVKAK